VNIKTHTANGVATLEIARPEKKNALTLAMYEALTQAVSAARAERSRARTSYLRSAGRFHVGQRSGGFHAAAAGG
jgi:enoyl-CoA hydratase/carnithine racemase